MDSKAQSGQYLSFSLGTQLYAVPIGTVREINRVSEITSIPRTPTYMAGVMDLRGKIIPVITLRMKLGIEAISHSKKTCIIVIETDYGQVGTIVDEVSGVIDLSASQIEPPPTLGASVKSEFLLGMGKSDNKVIILVDIVKTINDPEITRLTQEANAEKAAA